MPEPISRKIVQTPPFKWGCLLMSDLHVGGRNVDYGLIKQELDGALANGYNVNVNGDLFDLILPGDRKRYRPSVPHPRISHAGERMMVEAIDWAEEIFTPVAEAGLLTMLGTGNHEDVYVRIHHFDPILELVERLNRRRPKDSPEIAHGGYGGWIQYRFVSKNGSPLGTFRISYHHGAGGGSPVTRGTIDFARTNTWLEGADVVWKGHKHFKTYVPDQVHRLLQNGQIVNRKRYNIFTGSYDLGPSLQTQESIRREGRTSHYAEDALMPLQARGGWVFEVEFNKELSQIIRVMDEEVIPRKET